MESHFWRVCQLQQTVVFDGVLSECSIEMFEVVKKTLKQRPSGLTHGL